MYVQSDSISSGIVELTTMPLEQLTDVPEQALPEPTPTTVMGLQSRPSVTVRSSRTTPMRPKRPAAAVELAWMTASGVTISLYAGNTHGERACAACSRRGIVTSLQGGWGGGRTYGHSESREGEDAREHCAGSECSTVVVLRTPARHGVLFIAGVFVVSPLTTTTRAGLFAVFCKEFQ